MSDYHLDIEIIRETKDGTPLNKAPTSRPRAFEKVRNSGSDPNRKDRRRGFSLVERVEEAYPGTAARYHSPFWRLLRPPIPKPQELEEILRNQLQALGLGRLTAASYTQLRVATGLSTEPLPCWPHNDFDLPLDNLAKLGSLDALTILTCLVLECSSSSLIELRHYLGEWAACCLGTFAQQEDVKPFREKLWWIFNERILHNNWDLKQDHDLKKHDSIVFRYVDSILPLMEFDKCEQLEADLQNASSELFTHLESVATEYLAVREKQTYMERHIPPWDSNSPAIINWPKEHE